MNSQLSSVVFSIAGDKTREISYRTWHMKELWLKTANEKQYLYRHFHRLSLHSAWEQDEVYLSLIAVINAVGGPWHHFTLEYDCPISYGKKKHNIWFSPAWQNDFLNLQYLCHNT